MEKITVIVPCYNEEAALHYYYKEMSRVMDEMNDVDFELLFVNDGSKDKTLEIMMELAKKDSRVKYISFSRNFGKEAAMYAGFENSTGDYVCLMDADLQDPPRLLPEMLKAIREEGYDSAATRRVTRKGEPPIRSFFARMFYKIMNKISDTELMDGARDYRLMTRQFVNALLELKEYNRYMKGMFSFVGFNTKWLEFHNVERPAGKTKWSFKSLFSYAFKGIFSFSSTPITMAGVIGGILILIACFISLYSIFIHHLSYLTSLVLFLSGIQLVFVAILGQYCSSCYFESKQRPIYIIKNTNKKV